MKDLLTGYQELETMLQGLVIKAQALRKAEDKFLAGCSWDDEDRYYGSVEPRLERLGKLISKLEEAVE